MSRNSARMARLRAPWKQLGLKSSSRACLSSVEIVSNLGRTNYGRRRCSQRSSPVQPRSHIHLLKDRRSRK